MPESEASDGDEVTQSGAPDDIVPPVGVDEDATDANESSKNHPKPPPARESGKQDSGEGEGGSGVTAGETVKEATIGAHLADEDFQRRQNQLGYQHGQGQGNEKGTASPDGCDASDKQNEPIFVTQFARSDAKERRDVGWRLRRAG
ncbi:MAG: hypothetical protein PVTTEEND_002063 [Candidatus Fervidibacter sp.]